MYEEIIFKVGVWTGYFLTIVCILFFSGVALIIETRRHERFLVETKSVQQYEEWKKKNKWKIVKNK